jgi:Fic family protein
MQVVSEGSLEPGRHVPIQWRGRASSAWVPATLAERKRWLQANPLRENTVRRTEQAAALARQASAALPFSWIPVARLLTRSEGIASSNIEGIASPITEVALAIFDLGGSAAAKAVGENVDALSSAMKSTSDLFTHELLHEWHRRLMVHATYLREAMVGAFRTEQGWIGGTSPFDAALVTPPPEFISELMADLSGFINDTSLDPISQAAIAHAQFETIHPYADGNGRVGRVLIAWMLAKQLGLRVSPPVSIQFARDRGGYLSGLVLFQQGSADPWIRWFADAVARSASASIQITERIVVLLADWAQRLSVLRTDATALQVLSMFPKHFVLSAQKIATELAVSERAARSALTVLQQHGIAEQLDTPTASVGRPLNIWFAPELAAIVADL